MARFSPWEPYESRGSSTVLEGPRGEIPRGHLTSTRWASRSFPARIGRLGPAEQRCQLGNRNSRNREDLSGTSGLRACLLGALERCYLSCRSTDCGGKRHHCSGIQWIPEYDQHCHENIERQEDADGAAKVETLQAPPSCKSGRSKPKVCRNASNPWRGGIVYSQGNLRAPKNVIPAEDI